MQYDFNYEEIIGKAITYKDYLGLNRSGSIGFIEPYNSPDAQTDDGLIVWVYIVDEDPEYNNKEFIYANDKGEPVRFMYADMRLSNEIFIDE